MANMIDESKSCQFSQILCSRQGVPKHFEKWGRVDFERVAQSVPARTRKRFLVRFDAKAGEKLSEGQKKVFTVF